MINNIILLVIILNILLLIREENSYKNILNYINAIEMFGGTVYIVYDYENRDSVLKKLEKVNGILLPGGNKVGKLDFFLINYALFNNIKLLGICQGMQSMAIYSSNENIIRIGNYKHKQNEGYVHKVRLYDSTLKKLINKEELYVNSHHLETVTGSNYFRVVGISDDGLIEAIESDNNTFQLGIQWHPEKMIEYDLDSRIILSNFVRHL